MTHPTNKDIYGIVSEIMGTDVSYPIIIRDAINGKSKPLAFRSAILESYSEAPYVCFTRKALRELSYTSPNFKWNVEKVTPQDLNIDDPNHKTYTLVSPGISKTQNIKVGILWGFLIPIRSQRYTEILGGEITSLCVIHGHKQDVTHIPLQKVGEDGVESPVVSESEFRRNLTYLLENAPTPTAKQMLELLSDELIDIVKLEYPETRDIPLKPVICGVTFSHPYNVKGMVGQETWELLCQTFMDMLYECSIPKTEYDSQLELRTQLPAAPMIFSSLQFVELGIFGSASITSVIQSSAYRETVESTPRIFMKDVTSYDFSCVVSPKIPNSKNPTIHGVAATKQVTSYVTDGLLKVLEGLKTEGVSDTQVSADGFYTAGSIS